MKEPQIYAETTKNKKISSKQLRTTINVNKSDSASSSSMDGNNFKFQDSDILLIQQRLQQLLDFLIRHWMEIHRELLLWTISNCDEGEHHQSLRQREQISLEPTPAVRREKTEAAWMIYTHSVNEEAFRRLEFWQIS